MKDLIHPGFTAPGARLLQELRALHERYSGRIRKLSPDVGAPVFELSVEVEGVEHHLRMTLPRGYPRVPPEVREIRAPGGEFIPPRPGTRRLLDGQLCLFPHGNDPDAWTQERLAVEALEKAEKFLAFEHESRMDGGWAAYVGRTLFLRRSVIDAVRLPGSFGVLRLAARDANAAEFFAIGVASRSPGIAFSPEIEPAWLKELNHHVDVPWLCLPGDTPPWEVLARSPTALREGLARLVSGARLELVRAEMQMVLVRESAGNLDAVLARVDHFELTMLHLLPVREGDPEEVLFRRVDGLISARNRLADVPVVLVGVGSLGSTIALALARAGIRRFLLIDSDVLALENVCRHVGTVKDLGQPKVGVVEQAIHAIYPAARVEVVQKPLAWDIPSEGAGVEFERWLEGNPDALVIVTCAFAGVERQTNEILIEKKVPAIYASVLGAAQHGRIFRVLPGETPCYECILAAQDAEPLLHQRFVADGTDHENRVPYLQPSLPGLGIDITQVAMISARFALQTIAKIHGLALGFPDVRGDHLLWTNHGGWLFDHPLQACIDRIPLNEHCQVCGQGAAHIDSVDAGQATELTALLKQLQRLPETAGG